MADAGINAVRTYTVPPRWLLDAAWRHGLRVMVGLPWEQHVAFLEDRRCSGEIEARVRAGVRACAGHPAVLCYAIGNEIPSSIVRWHGPGPVERYLERLYQAAKAEDPDGLVSYVNYPSTEYLQLPFVDFYAFNVYLESQDRLEAYLARLQNLAGDRPLIMGEIGLDSRRHGEEGQAWMLYSQLRTAFGAGCAGAFVWTDEWHRGGYDVEDWDFGLTDRERLPKPALVAVSQAFADVPFPSDLPWPRISVVVCSYNGARTIRDCLEGLRELDYPDYEVIVVDDGSTDATAEIARELGVRLISTTDNRGLGSARNTGLEAASGEIVAYTDDDARPDPQWLRYVAHSLMTTEDAGLGGPNIPPPGDGLIADCVANAPGGPIHVLLTDREAEHVPGCNLVVRRAALEAIGGFDPQFRVAGDDVDLGWRLQQRGWTLGFSPAAMVWHRRRDPVRGYWKQQHGYGKAEALLERKWPEKYNHAGHVAWAGRLYGQGLGHTLGVRRSRIYHGTWGVAPFQSIYQPASSLLEALLLMPEWYVLVATLAGLSALSASWPALFVALPLLVVAVGASLTQAGVGAARAQFVSAPRSRLAQLRVRGLTMFLHLLQPLARLSGRWRFGLTPWRRRGMSGWSLPWPRAIRIWSERWLEPAARLAAVETALRSDGATVLRGDAFDRWDLEVWGGSLGSVRLRMAVEEHGAGRQMLRFWTWPRGWPVGLVVAALFTALSIGAALERAWIAAAVLAVVAVVLMSLIFLAWASATAVTLRALRAADTVEDAVADKPALGVLVRRSATSPRVTAR